MGRQISVVLAPEPDVQVIAFAIIPTVALQIVAEVEEWNAGWHRAIAELALGHLEFDFLRGDREFSALPSCTQMTSDGAEMAARSNHERGRDAAVDNPAAVGPLQ